MLKQAATIIFLMTILATPVYGEEIPLAWRDSGYTLHPGYTVSATLESDVVNYPFAFAIARSGVKVGSIEVMIDGERGFSYTAYVNVYVNGDREYREELVSVPLGQRDRASVLVRLEYTCDGMLNVYVDTRRVASTPVQDPAIIDVFEEEWDGIVYHAEGTVELSSRRTSNCGGTATDLPPEPEPDGDGALSHLSGALSRSASMAVTLVFLGVAVIVLLIVYSQAKKRGFLR